MSTDPLAFALSGSNSSARMQAALSTGTRADPRSADALIDRCAVEPDFFVRDMLTWALARLPADVTVPKLLRELDSPVAQARSQALHTLSKIGDARAWPAVAGGLLHEPEVEVARAAWRASVMLVPDGECEALAAELARELGRGDRDVQRSLSRALVALGDAAVGVLGAAAGSAAAAGAAAAGAAAAAAGAAADGAAAAGAAASAAGAAAGPAAAAAAGSGSTAGAGMVSGSGSAPAVTPGPTSGPGSPPARAHATATLRLLADPDADFALSLEAATRVVLLGAAPVPADALVPADAPAAPAAAADAPAAPPAPRTNESP